MPIRRVSNPPNPWHSQDREYLEPQEGTVEVFVEQARSIISYNESPDLGFRCSVNPYRGCHHGCAYCYARPSHQYLDFGAGSDFEQKIVAKVNAPTLLRQALRRPSWQGETIVFSGNTDCYQPIEATYRLTRGCLEACRDARNPVIIITKGALVQRDIDVLGEIMRVASVRVFVSIAFDDARMARIVEPWAPSPQRRYDTLAKLGAAGIPVGVALAPVIPGLNDDQVGVVLERARDAGAQRMFFQPVRLPEPVAALFWARIEEHLPNRMTKVRNALGAMRGGNLGEARFFRRFNGLGNRWQVTEQLIDLQARRLGYIRDSRLEPPMPPRRGQLVLPDLDP